MTNEVKKMKPIRVFNKTLHQKLWFWLSKYPWKKKRDWPGWKKFSKQEYKFLLKNHLCFACACASTQRKNCASCPLNWETKTCYEEDSETFDDLGLYAKFVNADSEKDAAWYAYKIATLPVRQNDNFVTIVI